MSNNASAIRPSSSSSVGLELEPTSRRAFLRRTGGGLAAIAVASLLGQQTPLASAASPDSNPLAPKQPHFPGKAERVIFLFMSGGPSHVDLFDPKPELIRLGGQPIPESFGHFKTRRAVAKNQLLPPRRP